MKYRFTWKHSKYSGQHAVCDLLQSCDVCLIQEHWLLHEQLSLLSVNNDFLSSGVSGMDSSDLLHGCPFGGGSFSEDLFSLL